MRARLIIVLSVIVVLLVGAAAFIALWGDGPTRPGVVTVNIAHLRPGHARAVTVQLPDKKQPTACIFLVRRRSNGIDAFLGVSTHLGCRLLLHGDPHHGNGFTITRQRAFEDPCGGSVFALNGACVGARAPRPGSLLAQGARRNR